MALSAGLLVDTASGALILVLGLFVLTRRPLRRVHVAFAVFAISWGLGYVAINVDRDGQLAFLPFIGAAAGLTYLVARFPRPLDDVRAAAAGVAAGATAVATVTYATAQGYGLAGLAVLGPLTVLPFVAATFAGIATFTVRFARAKGPAAQRERAQYLLLTAALLMDPGIRLGINLWEGDPSGPWNMALHAAIAAGWLYGTTRVSGRLAVGARHVAFLALGLPLVGLALAGRLGGASAYDSGLLGAARTLAVALLAYAILRHQLLGIDVKVRWGISKTTVAAVFVAAFFVASEAAQQFFGEQSGSQYVGILAAGALVFAIAPLSRLADRVAEKAVPLPRAERKVDTGSEASFRQAVRWAMREGTLSRDEERALLVLAERLGIGAGRALEVRDEVEHETPLEVL